MGDRICKIHIRLFPKRFFFWCCLYVHNYNLIVYFARELKFAFILSVQSFKKNVLFELRIGQIFKTKIINQIIVEGIRLGGEGICLNQLKSRPE